MVFLIQGIFTMQQDKKLQKVFEAFASDLQSYITMEVQRQVSAVMGGSNSNASMHMPAGQKTVFSKINMGALDQLREEVVDVDYFSEEKINELKEFSLKNTKKMPDVVSHSQAVDLSSLMENTPEDSDTFDTSKLDFLINTMGVGTPSVVTSSNSQEMKTVNQYTPGFAGLKQLLNKVRGKSI